MVVVIKRFNTQIHLILNKVAKSKIQEMTTEELTDVVNFMIESGYDIETLTEGSIAKQHVDELKLRTNGTTTRN